MRYIERNTNTCEIMWTDFDCLSGYGCLESSKDVVGNADASFLV